MNILHTSDWHIGRSLYGHSRYEEFAAFLDWLAHTLENAAIDVLLVAGDVFDSTTPSNRAQELYYQFLCRAARSCCGHTVVIAGNHDSPSFLNAPRELLKALDVHVIGHASAAPRDEVLVLHDKQGAPALIVCAVPYLRDRDIRIAEPGESIEDKERKLVAGIRDHYAAVGAIAGQKRKELGGNVPVVGMGHLFAAGGSTIEGDGVRELYVGSSVHVSAAIFPRCFDYLALGHLHSPQIVNGSETMRYSGSPLPMGFGESKQKKYVYAVALQGPEVSVQPIEIPVFRHVESITGDWDTISAAIQRLSASGEACWLEVIYEGDAVMGDLRERLETAVSGTRLVIARIRNNRVFDCVLRQIHEKETLDDLNVHEVFERCLAEHNVPEEQRRELLSAYQETLASLYADDWHAA